MAAYGVSFESSSNIEEAKEKKRQARQEAIQKAKQQYEKEERRKELKRQRGEDTWILPEVNQRLEQLGDDGSVKSKKKKKEKKSKKKKEKKKDKKEKRKTEAGDASSVDSEVDRLPIDEWMTFDFLAMKTVSTSERRAEKERQKEVERAKTRAASLEKLELNPFWKDGGSGLPPEEIAGTANKKAPVVNDGGLSWLKNSYRRMKEQAEREQRSLDSVVSERYGSVEEFQRRLTEAEEAVFGQRRDGRSARNGRTTGEEEDRKRWRRHEDTKERRSDRDSSPRRRGKYPEGAGEKRERHRAREEERSRDGDAFRERDRNEDEDMDGRRDRVRDNGGDRGSDRYRVEKREKQRPDGRSWNKHGVSLKGRFLKPSEDDDDCAAGRISLSLDLLEPGFFLLPLNPLFLLFFLCSTIFSSVEFINCFFFGVFWGFQATVGSSEDQEVLLYRTDSSGRAWPVKGPSGPVEPHGGRRKKKATHVGGERVRYFQDDDRLDLQEMVRREKMSSAMDQNALYSRMASKMMGKTDGDNYTLDDMFVSSAAQREGEGREEERMKNKAVGESRRLAASMEKCQFCFSSQELQKHLIVAIGCKVYLSLPAGVSLTEGHCLICPLQHHSCGTALDEDVWSEMQMFRRTLVRMFEDQDLDCVFMETHMNPRRKLHMVLECIPLPRELGDMAPIYFKKAIMECDEEWAMNKKIVDLSSRDIRQAVPRGLPYFAVDFGLQGGFAHVIENEQKFPHYFGKEIVGGMMDVEPRRWRKSIRENFDDQRKKVLQFAAWWKPFDCTKTEG
uniref:CWF19-like protein 2 n=1 Tax=Oryzias sinensis TaxID=183150 RepID=A0A8C7ZH44_9TELE